jgi:hypothetical protein
LTKPIDPEELTDFIGDAISDSMDMDWSASIGAKAVVRDMAKEGWVVVDTIFVPGAFACEVCDFRLTASFLNARDGSVTANNEHDEDCPNCSVPMTRVTWEQEARDAFKTAESQMNRAIEAETQLKVAKKHLDHMAAFIGQCNRGQFNGCYSFESLGEDMPAINAAIGGAA